MASMERIADAPLTTTAFTPAPSIDTTRPHPIGEHVPESANYKDTDTKYVNALSATAISIATVIAAPPTTIDDIDSPSAYTSS